MRSYPPRVEHKALTGKETADGPLIEELEHSKAADRLGGPDRGAGGKLTRAEEQGLAVRVRPPARGTDVQG
jgi:hypothetical protein